MVLADGGVGLIYVRTGPHSWFSPIARTAAAAQPAAVPPYMIMIMKLAVTVARILTLVAVFLTTKLVVDQHYVPVPGQTNWLAVSCAPVACRDPENTVADHSFMMAVGGLYVSAWASISSDAPLTAWAASTLGRIVRAG